MKRFLTLFSVLGLMVGPVAAAEVSHTTKGDQTALLKLVASDGMPSDRFGVSVSVSGDTALVGAPVDDGERGAAYVFTRVDGAWVEQAKLVASDGRSLRKFGYSVALSGDTAVIGGTTAVIAGAQVHADPTPGSAYVFERVGDTWFERAKLTARNGSTGDDFGNSVAVSGDTVVVSAGGIGVGGVVYVYVRKAGAWLQQAELTASDAAAGDRFGVSSVAVSGDTVVVGVPFDDVGSSIDQGSVYVFTRDGARWTQEDHLTAPEGAAGDNFGFSVSISSQTLVVGARLDDVGTNADQGSAYVFSRVGRTWTQQAHLIAADGSGKDEFGRSVGVSGDTAIVGAMRDKSDNVTEQQEGAAYVFTRKGATWTEATKLVAAEGLFGLSAAISRGTAVIGAGFADLHAGAAYVWEEPRPCLRRCRTRSASSQTTTSPPTTPVLHVGG